MAYKGLFASLVDTILHTNDAERQKLFFVTYQQYGTPADLLATVQESFRTSSQHDDSASKKFVGAFLLRWVENKPEDFADKKLGEELMAFAKENLSAGVTKQLKLKYLRAGPARTLSRNTELNSTFRTPFTNARPKEIACYITMIDWKFFSNIRPTELFDMAWQKANKAEVSPNITALANRFNTLSLWLADLIVESYSRSSHTAIIEKAIEVLKELFKINNFHSSMAVLSALNNSAVQRLRNLWGQVRKEHRACLHEFEVFMSMTDNFKHYRKRLAKVGEQSTKKIPVIPFLALLLRDLTFINDGNSETKAYQLNIEKMEMQGRLLLQLQEWQKTPYTFSFLCDEAYLSFFERLTAPKEDEVFQKSQKVQPGTLENLFFTAPRPDASATPPSTSPSTSHEEDLISDCELKDVRLESEFSEGLTDDLSLAEAEDLLREAGTDASIDFELDKVENMLTSSSSAIETSRTRTLSTSMEVRSRSSSVAPSAELLSVPSPQKERRNSSAIDRSSTTPEEWTVPDVTDWLRRAYLSQYIALFVSSQVDGQKLLQADHKTLTAAGISSFKERKMILLRIDKLKQEHSLGRPRSDSALSLSEANTSSETKDSQPKVPTTEQPQEPLQQFASSAAKGSKKEKSKRQKKPRESEENDQQVDSTLSSSGSGIRTRLPKEIDEEERARIVVERVVIGNRTGSHDTMPSDIAPSRKLSLLSRSHSKSFPIDGSEKPPSSATSAPSTSVQAPTDVGTLGGASVLICCDEEKWEGGKLGPYSYASLIQLIMERYDHIFSSPSDVSIVCTGIKKGGMKIKSDKDLRQLKLKAKENNDRIVVLNVHKR